jgi:glucose/arabinose dehydrogenase
MSSSLGCFSSVLVGAIALTMAASAKDDADRESRVPSDATQPAHARVPAFAECRQARALESGQPEVPEFEPAFPGQTRAPQAHSQTRYSVREIAGGFDRPWAIAFLPDRRMLVTEKPTGKLFIVAPDGLESPAVRGLPEVDGRDQGGLLDVEVAPDYPQTSLIYFSYYEPRPEGNGLAVARARLLGAEESPRIEDLQVIFRMQPTLDSAKHAGGRLVFTPDGKLLVTLGERSVLEGRRQARDLASHFGKIVRIALDGSVPDDNPYVGRAGAQPEIWSSGHRNVLAAALDAQQRPWIAEMGPQGGDELNLVKEGADYGWPTIGYGEEYSGAKIHQSTQAPGLEQPVYYWDPVISPSGLAIYSGKAFPEWKGNFFIGSLTKKALVRLVLRNDRVVGEEYLLTEKGARIREVVEGPDDGALYVLTDEVHGKLLALMPEAKVP